MYASTSACNPPVCVCVCVGVHVCMCIGECAQKRVNMCERLYIHPNLYTCLSDLVYVCACAGHSVSARLYLFQCVLVPLCFVFMTK